MNIKSADELVEKLGLARKIKQSYVCISYHEDDEISEFEFFDKFGTSVDCVIQDCTKASTELARENQRMRKQITHLKSQLKKRWWHLF